MVETTAKKILLIEDNETYRKLLKTALEKSGFTVFEAENGLRGLEIVRTMLPDLVLTDIYMPVMDGMTFLAEMKKDEKIMRIPVVMLTNVQEELDGAVKAGAEEAVLKASLTPTQVIDVCRKYLGETSSPPSTTTPKQV